MAFKDQIKYTEISTSCEDGLVPELVDFYLTQSVHMFARLFL